MCLRLSEPLSRPSTLDLCPTWRGAGAGLSWEGPRYGGCVVTKKKGGPGAALARWSLSACAQAQACLRARVVNVLRLSVASRFMRPATVGRCAERRKGRRRARGRGTKCAQISGALALGFEPPAPEPLSRSPGRSDPGGRRGTGCGGTCGRPASLRRGRPARRRPRGHSPGRRSSGSPRAARSGCA